MRRRTLFFSCVLLLTVVCTWFFADSFWVAGVPFSLTRLALSILFFILTFLLALGFCQAMVGFYVLSRGGDSRRITQTLPESEEASVPLAPTAVVMPVFNEDVTRVLEGLRVIYRSVEATGHLQHFDFFLLSDSNDPNKWIEEESSWLELCRQVNGFGRIFYRKRRQAINKKSGNVADFLRRWGRNYRHMVVLDADSIMTGSALVRLVRLMERNPNVGIIQTMPQLTNAVSFYARLQQFAARVYSPIFAAGLNYWQQAEGNYWGHNAIIRVAPFIEHCGLPDLPGREPFGGRILSHDYVEAALMRRAGYQVWLAYDIEGSFEEGPPTLIDAAKRDRRWCQGNLQHSWLLAAKGLFPVNRLHLLCGILSYVASPLWFLFLMLGTLHVFELSRLGDAVVPYYSHLQRREIYGVSQGLFLFLLVVVMLFVPKIAALAWLAKDPERVRRHGGLPALCGGVLLEMIVSMLLAPVQMLFHSKFVVFTLLGQGVSWVAQNRQSDDGTDWREAILTHWWMAAFGVVWGASTYVLSPEIFWWMSPVLLGLIVSAPVSILLSKESLGQGLRDLGLLLVPEEVDPPFELARLRKNLGEAGSRLRPLELLRRDYGLMQAVLDPYINAVHVSLLRQRKRASEDTQEYLERLRLQLLSKGPAALGPKDKHALLLDAESMLWLHRELWKAPTSQLADWWRLAIRQYNVLTRQPPTALYR